MADVALELEILAELDVRVELDTPDVVVMIFEVDDTEASDVVIAPVGQEAVDGTPELDD